MRKIYTLTLAVFCFVASASAQIKINEVYGGGGNSGSVWTSDFIELYNPTSSPVSLTGWSVQYASATGTTWTATALTGTIPANGYYLIKQAVGAGGTTPVPTPEVTGTIAMSATGGKVLLCNVTTAQTGANPTGAAIVDKVGFGAANGFEGTGPTAAPSNTSSVQRTSPGFDTDNNNTDFAVLASPTPTNAGVDITAPTVSTFSPANAGTGIAPALIASIGFSEAIQRGTGNIVVKKTSDNSVVLTLDVTSAAVTVSGSTVSFLLQSLAYSTSYYVEIATGAFKDNANLNFAGFSGSATWSFTITAQPIGVLGTNYSFITCSGYINNGFTQYTVTGNQQLWGCTTFGRDPANLPLGSLANGMQINGFSGTNIVNEDWLISPAFDLTSTTYPLLSFWSRTKFNGAPLQLKVSVDYPGYGNPNNYTWINLNGKFPAQTSDAWAESNNINLAAFKTTNVYFAFVYNSSADDGARWTLDDIQVTNSAVAPPPSVTISTTDVQFGFTSFGSSTDKNFVVTGNDITGDITLTSTGDFTLSNSAVGPFSNSITLTQAAANNIPTTVYTRFTPSQNNLNFAGTVTVSTPSVTDATVNLKATSIDPVNTLEIVNWNIEWFGSTTLGPTNNAQQQANVQTVLQNVGADLYGLVEVVDESRLATIVSNMPGYSYVISNYGSHTNTSESGAGPLSEAQKLAFVYKTSVFSNITAEPLVSQGINSVADLTNPAYNYFASGRFPYMMTADVTLNGITKTIRFILIHGKANTSPTATSYARRKAGSDTLQYTLNNLYPNDNIVVLGDINDDLDQTITDGIVPATTSYVAFTTDNTNFFSPTLALSLAGKKSTVSYNDVIDHVIVSNEMSTYYMGNSASILTDAASLVSNYGTTTTDHYPVFTRFTFSPLAAPLPVEFGSFNVSKAGTKAKISWTTVQELNSSYFVVERSTDSRNWKPLQQVAAAGNSSSVINYEYMDPNPAKGRNYYRIREVDANNLVKTTDIKALDFVLVKAISFFPNPVVNQLIIQSGGVQIYSIRVVDSKGQVLIQNNVNQTNAQINLKQLKAGMYILQVFTNEGIVNEKIIKQ